MDNNSPEEKKDSLNEETNSFSSVPLTYSPKKNFLIPFVIFCILLFNIFFFNIWYRLCLNLVMLGYFGFKELRLATVFFAVLLRIILYPLGRAKKKFDQKLKKAKEEFAQKVKPITNPILKDKIKREWVFANQAIVWFDWFYFCFYSMNAFAVGWLFLQPFNPERLAQEVYGQFLMPRFPMNTIGYIPLVGMVDLTKINLTLNLISAIGAGLVGLIEVVINQKTEKKELLMYLVFFPLGAYFITMWVPAGFEFSLAIFEALTIIIIFLEKFFESSVFKFFFVREAK